VNNRYYDVVVVGAGPAGAMAAKAASGHGVKVLLVDRKSCPGTPVQCAEYAPLAVRHYEQLGPGSIAQKIEGMLTFINGQLASSMAAPGYVLNRQVFDGDLVRRAQGAGAELWLGARVVGRTGRGIMVRFNGLSERAGNAALEEVECGVIIGADGPRSVVGEWMQSRNESFITALQYRLPLVKGQTVTEVHFAPEYVGGYAWLFPKGDTANVGLGVHPSCSRWLRSGLRDFIRQLVEKGKLTDTKPLSKTGGLIPVGGPVAVTQRENMLLAGDAAGQTHPVTGAGIMSALACGELAGQAAARAILEEDLTLLADYPQDWQRIVGGFLEKASTHRREFDRNWTYNPEEFTSLVKRTWIGFAE